MGLFRSKRRWPDPSTPKPFAAYPDLVEPAFRAVLALCQPATMTSTDRLYALYEAVRYVVAAELPGAFVECGVWKGGSVMMMAATLLSLGIRDRDIYLFDTFAGMTPPTDKDIDFRGTKAASCPQKCRTDRCRGRGCRDSEASRPSSSPSRPSTRRIRRRRPAIPPPRRSARPHRARKADRSRSWSPAGTAPAQRGTPARRGRDKPRMVWASTDRASAAWNGKAPSLNP